MVSSHQRTVHQIRKIDFAVSNRKRKHIFPLQTKEKFGTLAFYLNSASTEMSNVIQEATNASAYICDVCGNIGERGSVNWLINTRCIDHLNVKRI